MFQWEVAIQNLFGVGQPLAGVTLSGELTL